MSKFKMPKFTMPKFTIPKLTSSKATMSKATSRFNSQPPVIKVAIVAVLAVLVLWFVNYLLDGNLLLVIGWLLFFSLFILLLAVINPEETVKFVKQMKAEWVCYEAKLKRSIKELRALFSKKPELVVVEDEAEVPVSSATASPAEAAAAVTTPATPPAAEPSTATEVKPADATTSAPVVHSAPPAPVRSATPVNGGSDGIAAVAAATARVRRRPGAGGRKLAMPGDESK